LIVLLFARLSFPVKRISPYLYGKSFDEEKKNVSKMLNLHISRLNVFLFNSCFFSYFGRHFFPTINEGICVISFHKFDSNKRKYIPRFRIVHWSNDDGVDCNTNGAYQSSHHGCVSPTHKTYFRHFFILQWQLLQQISFLRSIFEISKKSVTRKIV